MSKKEAVKPRKQNQKSFDAVEDKGAQRRAVNKQIGETARPAPKSDKHED